MAKRKTNQTDDSVEEFIDEIKDEAKRDDSRAIIRLMAPATGEEPKMAGTSIVGFGKHRYRYANGEPAEICKVGFAPRSRSFAFYLPKYPGHVSLIKKLGKHKYSGGWLYVKPDYRGSGIVAALVARLCAEASEAGAKFLQGGGGEGPSRLYERVAIRNPDRACHLSGKAFQRFAMLDGLPVREIVRRLPAKELGLQPVD